MDNIIKVDFKDGKFYEVIRDLQQWSLGQKLCIEGLDTEKDIEVHFSLTECHGDAVLVATEVSEGNIIAKIPQFIMEGRDDHCGGMSYGAYAFIYERDGDVAETTHKIILVIKKRPKPTDYVYTETEVKTWTKLEERIGDIEKNSAETIKQAVNDYLKENPIESGTSDAVQYVEQTLTEEQQAQARTNIGAASAKEVGRLSEEIVDAVSGKADTNHTHDDRYYTESEIDAKIDSIPNYAVRNIEDVTKIAEKTIMVGFYFYLNNPLPNGLYYYDRYKYGNKILYAVIVNAEGTAVDRQFNIETPYLLDISSDEENVNICAHYAGGITFYSYDIANKTYTAENKGYNVIQIDKKFSDLNTSITEELNTKSNADHTHSYNDWVIESSTAGSTKKFKITIDDSGTISATEVTE